MFYIHILYLLGLIFISFISGIGYALYLFPKEKNLAIIFAPLIYYILICILSANLNFIGIATNKFSNQLILSIATISIFLLISKINKETIKKILNKKSLLIALLFALGNSFIVIYPAFRHNSFNFINDHTTYIIISEYLQDRSFINKANSTTQPWTDHVKLYQDNSLRMGAIFFTATIKSFFRSSHTINIYPAIVAFAEFILIISISGFLIANFRSINSIIFGLSILTISSIFNHQILLLGFLPQTFGLALVILMLTILVYKISTLKKNYIQLTLLNSLIFSALISTYQEIIPLFIPIIPIILIYAITIKKINIKDALFFGYFLYTWTFSISSINNNDI